MGSIICLGYPRKFNFARAHSTREKACQTIDKKLSVTFYKTGSPESRTPKHRKEGCRNERPFEFSTHRMTDGDYYQEECVSQVKADWNDVDNIIEGYLDGDAVDKQENYIPTRKRKNGKIARREPQNACDFGRNEKHHECVDDGDLETIGTDIDINTEIRNYMTNQPHNGHVICDSNNDAKQQDSSRKLKTKQSGNQTMSFYFRKQDPVEYTFYVDDTESNKEILLGRCMNAIMRQTGCQFIMYESSPNEPSFYKGRPVVPITVIAPHLSALKKCIGRIESNFPNFNAKAFMGEI